ncbi:MULTISPECIES: hypothetical protein [Niastella]|uniref:Uncharacterized protein n=1 Tax=Niastella soli TaxID=2821487 RepID=A0ABS3Z2V9_9BACT|nr:hypothetical protein [Niastella soli]MBO9204503.1 hypothetical protein [Niastella soli]
MYRAFYSGRTEFRRLVTKVDDSLYIIGVDTLKLSGAWLQGGNSFGTTGKFGTLDNNHIDFYTNNLKRGRWTNTGNLLIGTETDNNFKLQVNGKSWFGNDINITNPAYVGDAWLRMTGDLKFSITGPQTETLNFASGNIQSTVGVLAPWFLSTNPPSQRGNYYVPVAGGFYSTTNSPGYTEVTTFHTFTTQPPLPNSGRAAQTLVEINKLVNRGSNADSTDGTETGLRILFSVTGAAYNLRALETVNGDVKLNTTNGKTSIGLDPDSGITSKLDVTGDNGYSQFRLRKKYTPTSSSDANGNVGDMSWDDNFIYIKTAEGWKRSTLSSF